MVRTWLRQRVCYALGIAMGVFSLGGLAVAQQPKQRIGAADRAILHVDGTEIDGTKRIILTATSPDGRQIGIYPAHGAAWSPNGSQFAYFFTRTPVSRAALALSNLEGEVETIFEPKGEDHIAGWHPAWSPDGRKIAILLVSPSRTGRHDYAVAVIDADMKDLVSRHSLPEGTILNYHLSPPNNFRWSADGRKILVSWENVVVVDTEKNRVLSVTREHAVAEWAPDSDAVYYFSISNWSNMRERALGGFYIKKLNDANPVELMDQKDVRGIGLTLLPGIHYSLMVLSPTGTRLAIVTGAAQANLVRLQIHDLKERGSISLEKPVRTFHTDDLITAIEWAPDESSLAAVTLDKEGKVAIKLLHLETGTWRTVVKVNLDLRGLGTAGLELLGFKNLSWTR